MNKFLKNKIEFKDLILLFIVILFVIVNLVLIAYKLQKKETPENEVSKLGNIVKEEKNFSNNVSIPQTDEEIKRYLSTLGERDRMEYYCGEFFNYIKHKDYEGAYNLLYSDFKTNYFPTLEDFQKYFEEKFPKYFALEYDDITRQGDIYVLRLKIIDVNSLSAEDNIQRIVIKENYYNDFVMSFQVKE